MTTDMKIRTNGNYVATLTDALGSVLGSVGPSIGEGPVESDWINVPHGDEVTLSERPATEDEIHEAINGDQDGDDDGEDDGESDAG